MDLLLFAPLELEHAQRLLQAVQAVVPQESLETYQTLKDLSARLRQPQPLVAGPVTILLASHEDDLWEIYGLRELLADLPLILILPNGKKQTMDLAHSLRPRFLTYADSDFRDVVLVLARMLETRRNAS